MRFVIGLLILAVLTGCADRISVDVRQTTSTEEPRDQFGSVLIGPGSFQPKERQLREAGTYTTRWVDVVGTATETLIHASRSHVLVKPVGWETVNAMRLEIAAINATGCDAVFDPLTIDLHVRTSNHTRLPDRNQGVWRVETFCPGGSNDRIAATLQVTQNSDGTNLAWEDRPLPEYTYLSFSPADGFLVSYLDLRGKAWLWYPGATAGTPVRWIAGGKEICFDVPQGLVNPVSDETAGTFDCGSIDRWVDRTVTRLKGDRYDLATGEVPSVFLKCRPPIGFRFNRSAIGC